MTNLLKMPHIKVSYGFGFQAGEIGSLWYFNNLYTQIFVYDIEHKICSIERLAPVIKLSHNIQAPKFIKNKSAPGHLVGYKILFTTENEKNIKVGWINDNACHILMPYNTQEKS